MPRRKVVIVMPFGGNETAEKRAAILNFQRLRYLIEERVKVRPAPTGAAADNEPRPIRRGSVPDRRG